MEEVSKQIEKDTEALSKMLGKVKINDKEKLKPFVSPLINVPRTKASP